jgi:uncharacterized membrane-anchored protein
VTPTDAKRTTRKIPILWTALIAWCLIFFVSARFLLALPVSVFVVVALINFGVIGGLVFALRNAYRNGRLSNSSQETNGPRSRIFALWFMLILWCLILFNAARLATVKAVPISAFVVGSLIDLVVIGCTIIALRNAYRERKPQT